MAFSHGTPTLPIRPAHAGGPGGGTRVPGRLGRPRGFTLVELVMVLLLVAILAAVAVPRLSAGTALTQAAWRDQLQAGLVQARQLAQGHRRLVCVTLATGEIRLSIASANPATACNTPVPGPDGDARWARDSQGLALSQSPTGTLYFQPDGRITSDGAGTTPVDVSIVIAGTDALTLVGDTGHVR